MKENLRRQKPSEHENSRRTKHELYCPPHPWETKHASYAPRVGGRRLTSGASTPKGASMPVRRVSRDGKFVKGFHHSGLRKIATHSYPVSKILRVHGIAGSLRIRGTPEALDARTLFNGELQPLLCAETDYLRATNCSENL